MMSIDRTQKITPATLPEIRQSVARRADRGATPTASRSGSARTGTRVSLNRQLQAFAADDSQDIDYARLDSIKSALAAGELPVDADKISRALVADMLSLN